MFCDRQRADFARCRRLNGSSGSDDVICVSLLNDHIQSQGSTAAGQRKQSFTSRLGTGNIGQIETFAAGMRLANNQASPRDFFSSFSKNCRIDESGFPKLKDLRCVAAIANGAG